MHLVLAAEAEHDRNPERARDWRASAQWWNVYFALRRIIARGAIGRRAIRAQETPRP